MISWLWLIPFTGLGAVVGWAVRGLVTNAGEYHEQCDDPCCCYGLDEDDIEEYGTVGPTYRPLRPLFGEDDRP